MAPNTTSPPSLHPSFDPKHPPPHESSPVQAVIDALDLRPHPEGGYFVETDRDANRVPNPFALAPTGDTASTGDPATRSASTSIHYLLTPCRPLGAFHRNRARTVHTLHKGRGVYVVIHADECHEEEGEGERGRRREGQRQPPRIETFVVGPDVAAGEKVQWIVEGGKYKASFLLPDRDHHHRQRDDDGDGDDGVGASREGLLISETVVPGFEWGDHDFLPAARFAELVVDEGRRAEMEWLVRRE